MRRWLCMAHWNTINKAHPGNSFQIYARQGHAGGV